jgi:hypothetical protein
MRVIINFLRTGSVHSFLHFFPNGKGFPALDGAEMKNRLLVERPLARDGEERGARMAPIGAALKAKPRAARTVTVNLAESPLGWLKARALVSERQFEAGEALRADWDRALLGPRVTMRWGAAPPDKVARGAPGAEAPTLAQLAAKRRFDAAVAEVGSGLADILWRVVCAGEGMRDAERALGWPARAGRIVLCLALERLADHYRLK